MKVNVAGAGAGKTTKMSDIITEHEIPDGKIVFCIAFTNAAVENIRKKVKRKLGEIPDNIRVSTIHSFLFQEIIDPYHYFLYGKHFERLSSIDLPLDARYRGAKLSELENSSILHLTRIPEKAKWIVHQKSQDTKSIRAIRKRVLSRFASYCSAIYLDEAQDINADITKVVCAFDNAGIDIVLYGDPKQDVKGFGCFQGLIDGTQDVEYIPDCYRCPQIHLDFSNKLASHSEKQVADKKNAIGSMEVIFESNIDDLQAYIDSENYELCYISMKRDRFNTHGGKNNNECFENLWYETHRAVAEKLQGLKTDMEIERVSFYASEKMFEYYLKTGDAQAAISMMVTKGVFDRLSKPRYAQMISAFKPIVEQPAEAVVVKSIEIVKGLEAERCLFILTTDLAPYLFGERNEDNKTSHLLYVALTRSLNHLSILITREVEERYTRSFIKEFFENANSTTTS